MATIVYDIRQRLRNNGKYAVEWKLYNEHDTRWWNTGQYIPKEYVEFRKKGLKQKGMERHFKITDSGLKEFWDKQERDMCERVNRIVAGNRHMSAASIVDRLKSEEQMQNLDFLEFCDNWIAKAKKRLRGWGNYQSAVKAFRAFVNTDKFDVQEINSKLMFKFEEFLSPSPYKQNRYREEIARIYEDMRTEYNNDDEDDVIPDRLKKWRRTKKKINVPLPDKRKKTLTADNIRQIANVKFEQYEFDCQKTMIESREVFLLSFCLMGINLQDLWTMHASCYERSSGTIFLNRAKTGVHTEIVVPRQIKKIFEKYRDKKGKMLFDFFYRSESEENYSYRRSINDGLKELANKIGIKPFTFGAGRQTLADIARRQLKISKLTVNAMLQHTTSYKVLDNHYVDDIYTEINEANEKLMQFLFGDEEIKTYKF